jgi:hypothetical protein
MDIRGGGKVGSVVYHLLRTAKEGTSLEELAAVFE